MASRKGPYYNITANGNRFHSTSPSWLVVVIPFEEPKVYSSKGRAAKLNTRPPIIIMNDAVSISVSRTKGATIKGASVILKHGELDYPNHIRAGDYIGIWMANWQSDIDAIAESVRAGKPSNGFMSGLKFFGKVSSVNPNISVESQGRPSVSSVVSAKMFTEVGQSVYVTRFLAAWNGGSESPSGGYNMLEALSPGAYLSFLQKGPNGLPYASPDSVIRFMSSIFLGNGPAKGATNVNGMYEQDFGTRNAAITVPPAVNRLLDNGSSKSTYLKSLHFYAGIEKYKSGDISKTNSLARPSNSKVSGSFKYTGQPLLGYVFLKAAPWENIPLESLLKQWLNPIANEFYTSMRFDERGGIRPTITARQIPFTTPNFQRYTKEGISSFFKVPSENAKTNRFKSKTEFANLPRWVVDNSVVQSVNLGTSATSHVNFITVMGTSSAALSTLGSNEDVSRIRQDSFADQLRQGNYFIDEQDVARHGLFAKVMETQFDYVPGATKELSMSPLLTAMQVDFNLNNHLKWSGRVSLRGVQEPINEGDNCELDGVLYHIESIEHLCQMDLSSGRKSFVTVLSLSNGIVAESLDRGGPVDYPTTGFLRYKNYGKIDEAYGQTDVQTTLHKNRDRQGFKKGAE